MTDIRWQEPPAAKGGKQAFSKWDAVAAALREQPGVWAVVASGLKHAVLQTRISQAHIRGFGPAGAYEATSRRTAEGYDIYARYVGEARS